VFCLYNFINFHWWSFLDECLEYKITKETLELLDPHNCITYPPPVLLSPSSMIFVLASPRFCFVSLLKISCSLLLDLVGQGVDLEAIQARYKLVCWSFWPILWVHHEKHVRETCSKVGSISVVVP